MIKKRLLSMLVLLAAVVSGAWAADELYLVVDGTSATLKYDSNKGADDPYLSIGALGNTWQNAGTAQSTATTITVDATCKNFEGTSLSALFFNFTALTSINNLENLNMANVTKISGMFRQCSSLTAIDVSSFNTAQVTDMNFLFMGCTSLTTLDLSNFNTASVDRMTQMFDGCSSLENIYVGDGWNTDAVTASNNMFRSCSKLPNYASSKVDKTNAHTGEGGYLKLKPKTYKVTLQEGTEDATNWTVPEEAAEGASVTVTYNGDKKVKSVKAVKKSPIITWDNTNVFVKANQGKNVDKWNTSATFEGITISFNGEGTASHFYPYDTMGADLDVLDYGDSFTFTAPTGKKFAKIEINGSFSNLNDANWSTQANGIVWSNTPSNTVTIATTEFYTTDFEYITSIVFTLSE